MISLSKLCSKCRAIVEQADNKKKRRARAGIKQLRADCEKARRLANKGVTVEEIAKKFTVTIQRAERMILPGGPQGWRRGQPKLDYERIDAMIQAGQSNPEIAEAVGCHRETVSRRRGVLRAQRQSNTEGTSSTQCAVVAMPRR